MRPTRCETMMAMAEVISRRGTCSRLQVGVIIARENRVLVTGYNGAPAKLPHCNHNYDTYDEPCLQSVHAEANAVAFAAKHGISTEGAALYTTHDPCLHCAMLIINAGIRSVHAAVRFRDQRGVQLLRDARVLVFQEKGL